MLECFDALSRPLSQRFDAAVVKILDEAHHLMARRGALRKETEAHALHVTADEEPARYFTRHL